MSRATMQPALIPAGLPERSVHCFKLAVICTTVTTFLVSASTRYPFSCGQLSAAGRCEPPILHVRPRAKHLHEPGVETRARAASVKVLRVVSAACSRRSARSLQGCDRDLAERTDRRHSVYRASNMVIRVTLSRLHGGMPGK